MLRSLFLISSLLVGSTLWGHDHGQMHPVLDREYVPYTCAFNGESSALCKYDEQVVQWIHQYLSRLDRMGVLDKEGAHLTLSMDEYERMIEHINEARDMHNPPIVDFKGHEKVCDEAMIPLEEMLIAKTHNDHRVHVQRHRQCEDMSKPEIVGLRKFLSGYSTAAFAVFGTVILGGAIYYYPGLGTTIGALGFGLLTVFGCMCNGHIGIICPQKLATYGGWAVGTLLALVGIKKAHDAISNFQTDSCCHKKT